MCSKCLGYSLRYLSDTVHTRQQFTESKTDEERENDGLDVRSHVQRQPRHVTEKKIPSSISLTGLPAQQASFDLGGISHLKR